jgi:hypothetical protein
MDELDEALDDIEVVQNFDVGSNVRIKAKFLQVVQARFVNNDFVKRGIGVIEGFPRRHGAMVFRDEHGFATSGEEGHSCEEDGEERFHNGTSF